MAAETMTTDTAGTDPGRGGRTSRQRERGAVLRLLRGEDLKLVSRALGATAATLSGWRDAFLTAGEPRLEHHAVLGPGVRPAAGRAAPGWRGPSPPCCRPGRSRCGLDVGDDVRPPAGWVARLGRLHLVASPGHIVLVAVASLGIIGRADLLGRRRQFGRAAQAHAPPFLDVPGRPDLAQHLNRRQLRPLRPPCGHVERAEELLAVGADQGGQILARRLGFRQAVVLHRPAMAREKCCELAVLIHGAERVGDAQAERALGEGRMGNTAGFFGRNGQVLRAQHGESFREDRSTSSSSSPTEARAVKMPGGNPPLTSPPASVLGTGPVAALDEGGVCHPGRPRRKPHPRSGGLGAGGAVYVAADIENAVCRVTRIATS